MNISRIDIAVRNRLRWTAFFFAVLSCANRADAFTTDVVNLRSSITNLAASLRLTPAQVSASYSIISSNADAYSNFTLVASGGGHTYEFSYYWRSSNIYPEVIHKMDASTSGVILGLGGDGHVGSYTEMQSGKWHGVHFELSPNGQIENLSYAVTNAHYGETVQWLENGTVEFDYFDTNYLPRETMPLWGPE